MGASVAFVAFPMKLLKTSLSAPIPDCVTVTIKARNVTVKGPLGTLSRDLSHCHADIRVEDGKVQGQKKVVVESWFTATKQKSALKSALSAVVNLINGTQIKFKKVMRLAYSHFPINVTIEGGGKTCEIRNFLGEKIVRKIDMLGDCRVAKTDTKDEIMVDGTDIELVGRSAALINQSCHVKKKDIRKFLDGVYVAAYGQGDEMKSKI